MPWAFLLPLAVLVWTVSWTRRVWRKGLSPMRKLMHVTLLATLAGLCLLAGLPTGQAQTPSTPPADALPQLVDYGAHSCIPCQKMAPALESLRQDFAGQLVVEFIDVSEQANVARARQAGIESIPTQIFLDAQGTELWRHVGYLSREDILAKWQELGYTFTPPQAGEPIERWQPAQPDTRPANSVCYMCEGDIDARSAVTLRTEKGPVRLCSPHCYFILDSCLTDDRENLAARTAVTDWATGQAVLAPEAVYLYDLGADTGRPTIKAFASAEQARAERQAAGGSLLSWDLLRQQELATRCGFCDRACYRQDASLVQAGGVHTWGCCSHCALGVAARTGLGLVVHERDRHSGEPITVTVADGQVASVEPASAIAWYGQRPDGNGGWKSAGCFHQGFFVNQRNLQAWLDAHPAETGKQISIAQALADKMALTPQQVSGACKIGECSPR